MRCAFCVSSAKSDASWRLGKVDLRYAVVIAVGIKLAALRKVDCWHAFESERRVSGTSSRTASIGARIPKLRKALRGKRRAEEGRGVEWNPRRGCRCSRPLGTTGLASGRGGGILGNESVSCVEHRNVGLEVVVGLFDQSSSKERIDQKFFMPAMVRA